jgi:hypothetical protein
LGGSPFHFEERCASIWSEMRPLSGMRSALALCGAYAIAYILSIILHELGHGLAVILMGGEITKITLHPFGLSYIYYSLRGSNPAFASSGGLLYGTLFGLAMWLLTLLIHGPYLLPLRLIGMQSTAYNGLYLLLDLTVSLKGDPTALVESGVSRDALMGMGTFLLLVALALALHLQPALGIGPRDGFFRRLGILWGGILPYFILIALYDVLFLKLPGSLVWIGCGGAAILAFYAAAGRWVQCEAGWPDEPPAEIGWGPALGLLAGGMSLILAVLAFPVWNF